MSPINLSWIYLSEVKEILKQVVYSFFSPGKLLSILFSLWKNKLKVGHFKDANDRTDQSFRTVKNGRV